MIEQVTDEQRWQTVVSRKPQSGFLYGVVTTGVVCDTGCPSRSPRRDNVRYFESLPGALAAGYRPCKRCLGRSDDTALVAQMCRALASGSRVTELAARFELTSRHIQRLFRAVLDTTPKAFQIEARIQQFLCRVRRGESITDACYAAGFPSPSRLNEQLKRRTGMTPSSVRARTTSEPLFYTIGETPLGVLLLAQTVTALAFAGFYDAREDARVALSTEFPGADSIAVAPQQIEPITSAFAAALSGELTHLRRLPLDIRGTAFQRAVWKAARDIPSGTRVTYAEVAARIGRPSATRAVAGALAHNRIALAIPCHRVVPAGRASDPGGYRWGRERKAALLAREASA